jgi:tRNA pseudouridine13 synthase
MKLKQTNGDFIVNEILDNEFIKENPSGNYNLYILKKSNIENLKALNHISKNCNIPINDIKYCGLKDKYAITTQYISIPTKYDKIELNEKNLTLKYLKTINNPLKIGSLIGNSFKITVRAIDKNDFSNISKNLQNLEQGAPNYFDDQRFGSVFHNQFIAKYYLKGEYEKALKIILTEYTRSENKRIKDLKRNIKKNWGRWNNIMDYIKNNKINSKSFVNIIKYLNNPEYNNNYKEAFKYVDNRLKKLFVSSYQSYLWNECIKELLKIKLPKEQRKYVDYSCGTFLYYSKIDNELFNILKKDKFPTIAPDIDYNNHHKDEYYNIILKILRKERASLKDFNNLTELYKPSYVERDILNIPKNIKYGDFKSDELNKGKYKITIEFELNKGSYATIIIKRIFNI